MTDLWQPRADGTKKGKGFLGVLKRPDGSVSTEISVGVKIGGKEVEIPTLVPTLTKEEIDYLLNSDLDSKNMFKNPVGKAILIKAYDHATQRMLQGQSPFADQGEPTRKERIVDCLDGMSRKVTKGFRDSAGDD